MKYDKSVKKSTFTVTWHSMVQARESLWEDMVNNWIEKHYLKNPNNVLIMIIKEYIEGKLSEIMKYKQGFGRG